MEALGAFGGVLIIFAIIIGILWIILPFAVFGIKERLDRMITLLKQNNEIMNRLIKKPQTNSSEVKAENEIKLANAHNWLCKNCGEENSYYKSKCVKCGYNKD